MELNDRVSWNETYRTSGNVVANRTCWGTVKGFYDAAGSMDGYPIKGVYVEVETLTGDFVSLHVNDIELVQHP